VGGEQAGGQGHRAEKGRRSGERGHVERRHLEEHRPHGPAGQPGSEDAQRRARRQQAQDRLTELRQYSLISRRQELLAEKPYNPYKLIGS